MSVPVEITNGLERVSIQNSALSVTQIPSSEGNQTTIPFVSALTIDGDGTTTSLKVDGSVNPVSAFVGSEPDGDVYITQISALILGTVGGGNALLSDFAAITGGLTNGSTLFINVVGSVIEFGGIDLKTNFDWVALGSLTPPLGSDASAFRIQNVIPGNNSFGYNPRLDITQLAPPFGIRLKKLTSEKIGIIINDDLTVADVSAFTIVALGFKIITPAT